MWYCNMKKSALLFILLVVSCMQVNSGSNVSTIVTPTQSIIPAIDETEILVEGVAAIEFQGGAANARDNALDHALRSAVEQAVGTYITSETQVSNFQLISDNIYSRTSGYVSSYSIVNENQNNGLYRIVLRAIVKTDDIPEVLNFDDAKLGQFYRPIKKQVTLRIDADLIDWFKHQGKGYQTKMNAALREFVNEHSKTRT